MRYCAIKIIIIIVIIITNCYVDYYTDVEKELHLFFLVTERNLGFTKKKK